MFLKAADQVSDLNTKKWLIEVSDKLEYLVKHSEKKDYVVPIINEILDSKPPDVLEALLGLQIKAFGRFENLVIEQQEKVLNTLPSLLELFYQLKKRCN